MTLHQQMLLLLIALVPIQLNKFFFTQQSFVLGIPIDYLAYSIYLSDIAIVLYLITFFWKNKPNLKILILKRKSYSFTFLLFALYLVINSFLTSSGPVALYFAVKFLCVGLTALFASSDLSTLKVANAAKKVLTFSIVLQGALTLSQFLLQRSLGFWFLGERAFDAATPTIANANLFGTLVLRPYGTFPHPNVLGAFLLISLIITFEKFRGRFNLKKYIPHLIASVSIVLTNSKTALFALCMFLTFELFGTRKFLLILVTICTIGLVYVNYLSSSHVASIAERLILFQAAYTISTVNPIFGVGSLNFIPELAKLNLFSIGEVRLLQPVHNVFLLILSENGIFGLVLFLMYLFSVAKYAVGFKKLALFFSLLAYLSIDHFLWTLHQGQLIFALSVAFILSSRYHPVPDS